MVKLLFILGTRPEAIKLSPLILAFQLNPKFEVKVCHTEQHMDMVNPVLEFFGVMADYRLNIMEPNQTLTSLTSKLLERLDELLKYSPPDYVFVQGDTTTAFVGALVAFYNKVKIIHIEAGLRSYNSYSPFPEEINRVLISRIANYHFCPTTENYANLHREDITYNKYVVGNTGIDAFKTALSIIKTRPQDDYSSKFKGVDFTRRIILVTLHRRESFGQPFERVFSALKELVEEHPTIEIVYPLHKNPCVRTTAIDCLSDIPRIHLVEPLDYPELVWLMKHSSFIITDSGGIQEEAPVIGRKVLVVREDTERNEVVEKGFAVMVGTDKDLLKREAKKLITKPDCTMVPENVYGDGDASQKIVEILSDHINRQPTP